MKQYNARSNEPTPSARSFNNLVEEPNENGHATEAGNDHPNVTPSEPSLELGESLNPEHQRMLLQESGLSEEVVIARGYRTVEAISELRRLGFSDAQCNVPGLLVPVYSPSGEISNYQFRPDQPRIRDGKPVRYETPKGSRMTLDVHPAVRGMLGDPSVPLWVTEGVKKGDALASLDLCAVALLGVWNWRGFSEHGGKVALPEWEYIALNGRHGLRRLRFGRDAQAAGPRRIGATQGGSWR